MNTESIKEKEKKIELLQKNIVAIKSIYSSTEDQIISLQNKKKLVLEDINSLQQDIKTLQIQIQKEKDQSKIEIYRIKTISNNQIYIEFCGNPRECGILHLQDLRNAFSSIDISEEEFIKAYVSLDDQTLCIPTNDSFCNCLGINYLFIKNTYLKTLIE